MAIILIEFQHHNFNRQFIIPASATEWLQSLTGPVVIDVAGNDTSRWRVVSTLLHANEPSGFIGVHRWLKQLRDARDEKCKPATNVRIILSSVEAAKQVPLFHQRFVDGEADLNRLFAKANASSEAEIRAQNIKAYIREVEPESVVDLHNTSGIGQPFSVAVNAGKAQQILASYFCHTMILTKLRLGALMEQDFACPIVTIECGGVSDDMSHEVAFQGLHSFLHTSYLTKEHHQLAKIYRHPLRVELKNNISISYAEELNHATDVTFVPNIERYNLGITGENTVLGWSRDNTLPLRVVTEEGVLHDKPLFRCEDNKIITARPLRIFMATPSAVIAKKDCVFYAIAEDL